MSETPPMYDPDYFSEDTTRMELEDSKLTTTPSEHSLDQNNVALGRHVIFFDSKYSFDRYLADPVEKPLKIYSNLFALVTSFPEKFSNYKVEVASLHEFQSMSLHSQKSQLSLQATNSETAVIGLDPLRNDGYSGAGNTVAVMDNGIDFSHDLLSSKENGSFFSGIDDLASCGTHGTPVAGLIAADSQADFTGMAPGSDLYNIHFSCNGGAIEGDFLAAFDYLIGKNTTIDIVNTSFGGFAATWDPVIKRVIDSGIILVGSAGNSGPSSHSTTTGGPGNSIHGISVGALADDSSIAPFSSRGPSYELTYKPDLLAPGINVVSTDVSNSLSSYSGTSFSSPIVAGGISVLLDALQSSNVSYNPGLIKAALLESAEDLGFNPLTQGRGIVDFGAAYDLILSQNVSAPHLVSLRPQSSSIRYLEYIPQGMQIELPITLISSNPLETEITLGLDFTGKGMTYQLSDDYSQNLNLLLDTSQIAPNTNITGRITATVGNYSANVDINLYVGGESRGVIGIDRIHTYYDQYGADHIGGSNIGRMIELAMKQNFSVVEFDSTITSSDLAKIDILWMPDPFNILNNQELPLEQLNFIEEPLLQSEVDAIHDFIDSGNAVFITTSGVRYFSDSSPEYPIGLNTSMMNTLTSAYGIEAISAPVPSEDQPRVVRVINSSSLVKSVERVSYLGNYLQTSSKAWPLTGDQDRAGIAFYQDPVNLGRMIVSSTNYWMDNIALNSGYSSNTNDIEMSKNVWSWLSQDQHIIKLTEKVEGNTLFGSFQLPEGMDSSDLALVKYNNGIAASESIVYSRSNDIFSFSTPLPDQGLTEVFARLGEEYVSWTSLRDNTGPEIKAAVTNPNNTNYWDTSFIVLKFNIYDEYSDLDQDSLSLQLNKDPLDAVYSFDDSTSSLRIIIQTNDLVSNTSYVLDLSIKDILGNEGRLSYHFGYEVDVPDVPTTENKRFPLLLRSGMVSLIMIVMYRKRR